LFPLLRFFFQTSFKPCFFPCCLPQQPVLNRYEIATNSFALRFPPAPRDCLCSCATPPPILPGNGTVHSFESFPPLLGYISFRSLTPISGTNTNLQAHLLWLAGSSYLFGGLLFTGISDPSTSFFLSKSVWHHLLGTPPFVRSSIPKLLESDLRNLFSRVYAPFSLH